MSEVLTDSVRALVPVPVQGRRFTGTRPIRMDEVTVGRRLRLDSIARFLQDVAADDAADAGFEERSAWVLRRMIVAVLQAPRYGERLTLTTFCSGSGSHWAERRTSLAGDRGGRVEAAVIAVCVDPRAATPRRLSEQFHRIWGETAGSRSVSARLGRDGPAAEAVARPWTTRAADFDALGHLNNAITLVALEDSLVELGPDPFPGVCEVEFRHAVVPGEDMVVREAHVDGGVDLWLLAEDRVRVSARYRAGAPAG